MIFSVYDLVAGNSRSSSPSSSDDYGVDELQPNAFQSFRALCNLAARFVTGDENQEFTVPHLVTSSFSKAMGLRKILELGKFDKQVDEILQLMQLVALHNQLNQKRIFSQKDVETALAKKPEFLPIWMTFVKQGDVPFVKIVADGEDAEYQFRHLSFQEALAAQVLADSGPVGIEATGRPGRLDGRVMSTLD